MSGTQGPKKANTRVGFPREDTEDFSFSIERREVGATCPDEAGINSAPTTSLSHFIPGLFFLFFSSFLSVLLNRRYLSNVNRG